MPKQSPKLGYLLFFSLIFVSWTFFKTFCSTIFFKQCFGRFLFSPFYNASFLNIGTIFFQTMFRRTFFLNAFRSCMLLASWVDNGGHPKRRNININCVSRGQEVWALGKRPKNVTHLFHSFRAIVFFVCFLLRRITPTEYSRYFSSYDLPQTRNCVHILQKT